MCAIEAHLVPYSVGCDPAPLTITVRPRLDWQLVVSAAWICFIGYELYAVDWHKAGSDFLFDIVFLGLVSFGILVSFIRRERIEIYPDRMIWRKTYFGFTKSRSAPIAEILAIEWNEGEERGRQGKGPDYVEFYLTTASVKACFGFSFEDFEKMREDIRSMYPVLVKRWGTSTVRSKNFTLLNLT
jgi:hypothetical protein